MIDMITDFEWRNIKTLNHLPIYHILFPCPKYNCIPCSDFVLNPISFKDHS